MDEDWAIDVRKYVPNADSGAIAGIIRYCGIALRNRDSSLVSFTDPAETDRVRENYLKKKLALVEPDSVLDGAIAAVGERMSGDSTRNRVTVYYLLAEHFGKLGLFGAEPVAAVAPVAAVPLMAVSERRDSRRAAAGIGIGGLLPIALMILGGLGILYWVTSSKPRVSVPAAVAVTAPVAAPVVAAPAIPDGAGIVTSEVEGRPMVSIYFDTAKYDIYPNFAARTEPLRAYLAANPDTHLQLSGFNDPRGDPAFNAELSKNRAFAVRDALAQLGVPLTSMDLVKPAEATDTVDTLAVARRVDVTVLDGPVPAEAAAAEAAPAAQ